MANKPVKPTYTNKSYRITSMNSAVEGGCDSRFMSRTHDADQHPD